MCKYTLAHATQSRKPQLARHGEKRRTRHVGGAEAAESFVERGSTTGQRKRHIAFGSAVRDRGRSGSCSQSVADDVKDAAERALAFGGRQVAQRPVVDQRGQAVHGGPRCVLGTRTALRRHGAHVDELVEAGTEQVVRP
jgi:hypothetical protein